MKLRELKLFEEAIPQMNAKDVWDEAGEESAQYVSAGIYHVIADDSFSPIKYEVFQDKNGVRKLIGKMSQDKLLKSFTPVRANQTADAEGFTLYRENDEYDVIKYSGDTVKVKNDNGDIIKINKGDFIIRDTDDDDFLYSAVSSKYFEQEFIKK